MAETDSDAPAFADMVNGAMEFTIPIAHKMGVKALEVRPGFAATTVPIEGNGNHFGVMYAGVLFTVAEILGGAIPIATFDNSKYYPLVKDLQIFFRKPAKTDVRAQASLSDAEITRIAADAEANGKADFTLEATVTDADGVLVAETRGLYQLRARGK
jgi:thioesterase domain-containing protein